MEITFLPLILLGAAVLLLAIFFYYVPFLLWISAKVSGVNISLIQLFLMRIRKVPPYIITRAMIEAHKAGIKTLTRDELEAHYLAGGHVLDFPNSSLTGIVIVWHTWIGEKGEQVVFHLKDTSLAFLKLVT